MKIRFGIEKVTRSTARNIYGKSINNVVFYYIITKGWRYYLFGRYRYFNFVNANYKNWQKINRLKVSFTYFWGTAFETREQAQEVIDTIKKDPNRFILF